MNVAITFCSINNCTDKMIRVMNSDLGSEYIKTVPLSDPTKLTAHASSALRSSIHTTLTRTGSRKRTTRARGKLSDLSELSVLPEELTDKAERDFSLTEAHPDWGSVTPLRVSTYMHEKVVDVSSLRKTGPLKSMLVSAATAVTTMFGKLVAGKAEEATIQVAPEPFAHGNLRFARHGRIKSAGDWIPCVLKDFKTKGVGEHTLERYLEEMEVNSIASALAKEFNERFNPPTDHQVGYVVASVVEVKSDGKGERPYPFFFVEDVLVGKYTRYSYNTGYWEEGLLDEWLLRFALWTHEVTDGFMMVADLQGVQSSTGYMLTDPVVLCKDLSRFGSTNLGEEMMKRCKASAEKHLCDLTGRS